jgi:hypothetical protein
VRLWGFGFAYGTRDEQMFVNRYDFRPRILRQDLDRWEPPVALPLAADSILLEAAARWVAWYERSVTKKLDENYRNQLLPEWKEHRKHRMLPAEDWLQLADDLTTARQMRLLLNRASESVENSLVLSCMQTASSHEC